MSELDPIEALNQQEITISLNARETAAVMMAIVMYQVVGVSAQDKAPLRSVLDKFGPSIYGQVAKQIQIKRDGRN